MELLEAHPKLTIAEAMAIALDTHADGCEDWQAALRRAAQAVDLRKRRKGVDPGTLKNAIDSLLAWDGMMDQRSSAATLYRGLRIMAEQQHLQAGGSKEALVDALAETAAWLVANYGTAEVAYGRLHRVRRGQRPGRFPAENPAAVATLRTVSSSLEGKVFYGHDGQNWTQLVEFRPAHAQLEAPRPTARAMIPNRRTMPIRPKNSSAPVA